MSTTTIDTYSDHDMQCPAEWENGFKEGIVQRFGDGTRQLSHPITGDVSGSTFTILFSDHRRNFRERLASPNTTGGYSSLPLQVKMTTRANRAALGTPYTVFVGPIIDAQPRQPLAWELTLGDVVYQSILSDQAQQPWRRIGDSGLLDELDVIYDSLDLDTPEPIIYGEHIRVPDSDPASQQGFVYEPTFLGIQTLPGSGSPGQNQWYVWLVAGHALADILDLYLVDSRDPAQLPIVTSVIGDEGTDWLVPHYGGWNAMHGGNPYVDYTSPVTGAAQRYTLIYGKVGSTDPERVLRGEVQLAVPLQGVESTGEGIGAVITDRLQQYKHFLINYVANFGPASYQSGAWLTNPIWDLFDGPVSIVDEDSFTTASAIAVERLPQTDGSPFIPAGYIGAAIIGAHAGDRATVRRWIADWNRSCSVRFGVTHLGQLRVVMLHPTEAIKAAAPLYTDAYEILRESFDTSIGWPDHANRIPFRGDMEYTSGQWKTTGVADQATSITNYGRVIVGEERTYPMAPGITALFHLANIESLMYQDPPRVISLEATVGPGPNNESLGYLDLGDYIRYKHFAGVNNDKSEIRLAQIVRHQVQAGKRRVRIDAIDVEGLIAFDTPPLDIPPIFDAGSPGSPGPTPGSPFGGFDPDTLVTGTQESITCP